MRFFLPLNDKAILKDCAFNIILIQIFFCRTYFFSIMKKMSYCWIFLFLHVSQNPFTGTLEVFSCTVSCNSILIFIFHVRKDFFIHFTKIKPFGNIT